MLDEIKSERRWPVRRDYGGPAVEPKRCIPEVRYYEGQGQSDVVRRYFDN